MVIQHNMASMNANRQLGITQTNLTKSTEKLSSGYRVNRAADDAAGLAISEKMRGQIRGLNQASRNAEDGISLIQTAEGALQETQNIIQRMRELSVQAASDTNTDDDREQIQQEISQLTQEVDRIATSTEYNTMKLLDGTQQGSTLYAVGNSRIEASFANGSVSLVEDPDQYAYVAYNDVLRIEILQNATATVGTLDTLTSANPNGFMKLTSLNGVSANVTVKIATTGDATITIANGKYSSTTASSATMNLTYQISGAASLKANDVVTITLRKMVQAAPPDINKPALRLQVGANAGQEVCLGISDMRAKALHIIQENDENEGEALKVTSQADASLAIEAFDMALQRVSKERAKLGAMQNRIEHTVANVDTAAENLQNAESGIRDTDMADEMTRYSKDSILLQAGQSMLAQANQMTQGVLSLLQ